MNGVSEDKMIDMVKKEWNQLIFVIFAIFAFFDLTNSDQVYKIIRTKIFVFHKSSSIKEAVPARITAIGLG